MRGEYTHETRASVTELGSPPLARGILYYFIKNIKRIGITPACAGNTPGVCRATEPSRDHPRLRGEYQFRFPRFWWCKGSPPLARGIPPIDPHRTKDGRITPACAGNTVFFFISAIGEEDHPRLRGEYSRKCPTNHILRGSPPLARGIHLDFLDFVRAVRITPACAGNTRNERKNRVLHGDHPRLRGEYRQQSLMLSRYRGSPRLRGEYMSAASNITSAPGSPPLARGILRMPPQGCQENRITPACAGNTGSSGNSAKIGRDHPRLRGEYARGDGSHGNDPGSPPLARGILP